MDIVCDNCFYIYLFLCLYVIFISYFDFNLKLMFEMKIKNSIGRMGLHTHESDEVSENCFCLMADRSFYFFQIQHTA